MKRLAIIVCCIALAAISPIVASGTSALSLASLFPPDAILFATSPDMKGLLAKVKSNPLMKRYAGSTAAESLADSKLYLKLTDRFKAMEDASGFGMTLENIEQLAGGVSAFALYDIGSLQFLFVTEISPDRVMESALWLGRETFEERKRGDTTYYVVSQEAAATTAFAIVGDRLILSNDLGIFEDALGLMTGGDGKNLAGSDWFKAAQPDGAANGDLTVVLDQDRLNSDLYFRTYWIHGNATDFGWIKSTVLDLKLGTTTIEEKRWYAIASDAEVVPDAAGVSDMARAPKDALWLDAQPVTNPNAPATAVTEWIVGDIAQDAASFTNTIEGVLAPAKPTAIATTVVAGRRLVAIRLGDAKALDISALKKAISSRIRAGLSAGDLLDVNFQSVGGGIEAIRLPLLESQSVAMQLKGNVLIVASDDALIREYNAAAVAPGLNATDNVYLRIEAARSADQIGGVYRTLTGRANWDYADSETFFSEPAPSLLFIASGVKTLTARGKRDGNYQTFEATYELAK